MYRYGHSVKFSRHNTYATTCVRKTTVVRIMYKNLVPSGNAYAKYVTKLVEFKSIVVSFKRYSWYGRLSHVQNVLRGYHSAGFCRWSRRECVLNFSVTDIISSNISNIMATKLIYEFIRIKESLELNPNITHARRKLRARPRISTSPRHRLRTRQTFRLAVVKSI